MIRKKENIENSWYSLRSRCLNKNSDSYKYYGGRGIKCEWNSYSEFKSDMYESYIEHVKEFGAANTSIDRIDFNKNYCRKNCRWATKLQQARNRRNNVIIEFEGKSMCMSEWAKSLNISYNSLSTKYYKGEVPPKLFILKFKRKTPPK